MNALPLLIGGLLLGVASAQDEPITTADLVPLPNDHLSQPTAVTTTTDPDLPQPFDPSTLAAIVENPPFSRIVSVSDSLVLTGMAYVDGKPVVTIFDKETKQSIVVTEEPNLKGWKLVGARPSEKIDFAQAQIAIGGETFNIRHAALSKDDMKRDSKSEHRDHRDGPSSGGDRYSRGHRGPSDEDRKKYESLSEKARDKFRNALRDKFGDDKFRNAPEEERRNAIRGIFEKIQKEDQGGK